eukprot:TRINITY_DN5522_c0_g1_i7.p1 TRINITY_DN5522_c0_g1~~TRINITY_DN5522_c0_g1_i7.p1  ORF type:complete len:389 (+),score=112.23 TRINITY_DN5522_c0_g1_i7:1400-2566(+)
MPHAVVALKLAMQTAAAAAAQGHPGGPEPSGTEELWAAFEHESLGSSVQLLLTYGTSRFASAGHIAVALYNDGEWCVYTANGKAVRGPRGSDEGAYADQLLVRVPLREYLYGTGARAPDRRCVFGIDYGELYKRSVAAVRVWGSSPQMAAELNAFFTRVNEDYTRSDEDDHQDAGNGHAETLRSYVWSMLRGGPGPSTGNGAEYYPEGRLVFYFAALNCAQLINLAFGRALGWADVPVPAPVTVRAVLTGHAAPATPTGTALAVLDACAVRGYNVDCVLFRKVPGSTYVAPEGGTFDSMQDRFPSVFGLDFLQAEGHYECEENLLLELLLEALRSWMAESHGSCAKGNAAVAKEERRQPTPYELAHEQAAKAAKARSHGALRRVVDLL